MAKAKARIMVIAEESVQRLAFSEAVKSAGYALVDSIPSKRLSDLQLLEPVDLWLIDAFDSEEIVANISDSGRFLLGFTPAPPPTERKHFDRWQRKLIDKLWKTLGKPEPADSSAASQFNADKTDMFSVLEKKRPAVAMKPQTQVVLLGASLGGPEAVKEYLDHLSPDLPVALVLAQHTSSSAADFLAQILTRQNMWNAKLIGHGDTLEPGMLSIVPPNRRISFHHSGRMYLEEQSWSQPYQPNISEVFESAAEQLHSKLLYIVFSGMGDDGSKAAKAIHARGWPIWVQAPESAICSSQPSAMLSTGMVSMSTTPARLALMTSELILKQAKLQGPSP